MSERLTELALRKQRLLMRSADLRDRMRTNAEGLSPIFLAVDRLRTAGAAVARHPEWVAAAMLLLLIVRPRFVWRWAQRGFVGWRMWRSLRDLLQPRAARLRGP